MKGVIMATTFGQAFSVLPFFQLPHQQVILASLHEGDDGTLAIFPTMFPECFS